MRFCELCVGLRLCAWLAHARIRLCVDSHACLTHMLRTHSATDICPLVMNFDVNASTTCHTERVKEGDLTVRRMHYVTQITWGRAILLLLVLIAAEWYSLSSSYVLNIPLTPPTHPTSCPYTITQKHAWNSKLNVVWLATKSHYSNHPPSSLQNTCYYPTGKGHNSKTNFMKLVKSLKLTWMKLCSTAKGVQN